MIDKLRPMAIFAAVVDQGSFRGAAQVLSLAPSRVSEIVSGLEADLGVTLLYRTTRQLSLTHEGRLLHEKTAQMLRSAAEGLDAVSSLSQAPTGSLVVSVPAFVAQTALMETLANFAKTYPGVEVRYAFSDSKSDLIRDGFDVVIRAGWLEDSELMSRSIGTIDRYLVASPDYVAQRPVPTVPKDLEDWDWVRFAMRPDTSELTGPNGEVVVITGTSNVSVTSAEALYEFARQGLGVTAIPENLARRGFDRGELVHVLPAWSLQPLGLYAVWPDGSRRENLTTLFVRYLAGEG